MKISKTLAIGALSLATLGLGHAQTTIRIVASNGDRIATQNAIGHLLATGNSTWTFQGINGNTSGNSPTGSVNSIATGANFGAWSGTFQGTPVVIKVSYAGALAGVAAVASNPKIAQRFVVSVGTGTGSVPNPLTGTTLGTDYELGNADFGFSTNFQSTSPFNGTFNGNTYDSVTQEVVGVSPLGFYASPGFPGDNITTQQAQLLYGGGSVSLALFTGTYTGGTDSQGDLNKIVWAIGRNTDAGQRFGATAEIGLGTLAAAVTHWQPTIVGSGTTSGVVYGGTATSQKLWPAETVSNIVSPEGRGGYNSGANLAPILTTTLGPDAYKGKYTDEEGEIQYLYPSAIGGYYIGYLTSADGNPRVLGIDPVTEVDQGYIPAQNRGKKLKYNGVEFTNSNVQSGKYTAWLYNRILKPGPSSPYALSGVKLTFANALRDQIKNVDATTSGLYDDTSFKVQRFTDGGLVIPK